MIERVPAAVATSRLQFVSLQRSRACSLRRYRGPLTVVCDTATEYRLLTLPWRFLFRPRISRFQNKKRKGNTRARKKEEDSDARMDELSREGDTAREVDRPGEGREEDIGGAMWMTRIGDGCIYVPTTRLLPIVHV